MKKIILILPILSVAVFFSQCTQEMMNQKEIHAESLDVIVKNKSSIEENSVESKSGREDDDCFVLANEPDCVSSSNKDIEYTVLDPDFGCEIKITFNVTTCIGSDGSKHFVISNYRHQQVFNGNTHPNCVDLFEHLIDLVQRHDGSITTYLQNLHHNLQNLWEDQFIQGEIDKEPTAYFCGSANNGNIVIHHYQSTCYRFCLGEIEVTDHLNTPNEGQDFGVSTSFKINSLPRKIICGYGCCLRKSEYCVDFNSPSQEVIEVTTFEEVSPCDLFQYAPYCEGTLTDCITEVCGE